MDKDHLYQNHCEGWHPQNGIIFWRVGPFKYRLPLLGEGSRNPSVSVYQLVLLWDAVFSFSECFWTLSTCLPILCWVFSSFWPKTARPLCSALPIHPISLWVTIFLFVCVPGWKNQRDLIPHVLKGKCFADVEEVKQKTAEALKGIKINEFKNSFEKAENYTWTTIKKILS